MLASNPVVAAMKENVKQSIGTTQIKQRSLGGYTSPKQVEQDHQLTKPKARFQSTKDKGKRRLGTYSQMPDGVVLRTQIEHKSTRHRVEQRRLEIFAQEVTIFEREREKDEQLSTLVATKKGSQAKQIT